MRRTVAGDADIFVLTFKCMCAVVLCFRFFYPFSVVVNIKENICMKYMKTLSVSMYVCMYVRMYVSMYVIIFIRMPQMIMNLWKMQSKFFFENELSISVASGAARVQRHHRTRKQISGVNGVRSAG